jgi:hypothetical protein
VLDSPQRISDPPFGPRGGVVVSRQFSVEKKMNSSCSGFPGGISGSAPGRCGVQIPASIPHSHLSELG